MKQDAAAPLRRRPPRAALILGALGAGAVVLVASGWVFRVPIADWALRSMLASRGIEGEYQISRLDLGGLHLAHLRLGPENLPDATTAQAEFSFAWGWPGPRLEGVRLIEPRLRAAISPEGKLSLGQLDRLSGPPSGGRPSIPRIRLDIEEGTALLDSPYGALTLTYRAAGVLGRDFTALADLAPVTRPGEAFALDQARATLRLRSDHDDALSFVFAAAAKRAVWDSAGLENATLTASGRTMLDFSSLEAEGAARAASLTGALTGGGARAQARVEAQWSGDGPAPQNWLARLSGAADRLAFAGSALAAPRMEADLSGGADAGEGAWSLRAAALDGLGLRAPAPIAGGDLTLARSDGGWRLASLSRVLLTDAALDAKTQEQVRRALPDLAGAPIGPPLAAAERALDTAADRFTLTLPFRLDWQNGAGALSGAGPIEAAAGNGVRIGLAPLQAGGRAFTLALPQLTLDGAAQATISGGGAPDAALRLSAMSWSAETGLAATGALAIQDWRTPDARLAADALGVRLALAPNGSGQLGLKGAVVSNGPLGDGEVRDLRADLDLAITWDNGWRVIPAQGCLPIRVAALETAGFIFGAGAFELCPAHDGALIAATARDQLTGGFTLQSLHFDGRMVGEMAQPARLRTGQIIGRFSGVSSDIGLDIGIARPSLSIDLERIRTMNVLAERLTANARIHRDGWRIDGAFEAGALADASLPGAVSAIAGRWSAAPERDGAVIRVHAGEALVADQAPQGAPADRRPAFHDMRLRNVNAALRYGEIDAQGDILLAESARQLAAFTAHHDIASGDGQATVTAANIVFDHALQPDQLTELARGVAENVRGPIALSLDARWTPETMTAAGRVTLQGVSLSTASMPVIENVRGVVAFDDLFLMTTPPGQAVEVGLINPGIEVKDGLIQFQLLRDGRVAIEAARWPFAAGELGVTPTTITLGSEETHLELTLADVDVAELIAQLNMPDLHATGRVEGRFPLRLSERAAIIDNGVLRASPEGGTIAYVGAARQSATGPARLAFDALASFRYDNLSIRLNGDLGGDVVGAIEFSGRSAGEPIDVAQVSPVPGFSNISVRGVPFAFNVTVTAPFRRLAEAAARVTDARSMIDQAIGAREESNVQPPAPVDPAPVSPR